MLKVGDTLVTTVDLVFKSIAWGENVVDAIIQGILRVDFRAATVGRVGEGRGGEFEQSSGRGADGMR